ncbi:hypothetical protein [Aquimarina brevivitae]|uniref:Lipoprotein n=1 Tax=Aquimarina brevivitae TaxID=323412 RepID=A0A4Q7NX93_9FLAO|nr:hypothetical protein [Aquimarina brevivitae]RZS91991.1 hypothetical protein EV197_3099 [Aquimarina brevivitae]
MNTNIFKIFGLVVSFLFVIACTNEEATEQLDESTFITEEAELSAKVDNATEVISDTFLQVFENEEAPVRIPGHRFLPDCATVTVSMTNTTKNVTVDFGSEGCVLDNGNVLKGKLIMAYAIDTEARTLVIEYSLENFYVNETQFEGSRSVTRQKENENGNPQYAMAMDLTITFADGTTATRSGTKTREWIEGSFNGNWGDNVFLINGSWSTTFRNGNTHSTTIVTPLRREASCRFIVSGAVELVRSRFTGTLDYGDGACDNLATFENGAGDIREIRL